MASPEKSLPPGNAGNPAESPHSHTRTGTQRVFRTLSPGEDPQTLFLDEHQEKASTVTRLFRNAPLFRALTGAVIPRFSEARRPGVFRIWSAGCSSGEEVYSLVMAAAEAFGSRKQVQQLEAYGTDINPHRIREARSGRCLRPSPNALSEERWQILGKYADISGAEIRISEEIRSRCHFLLFDLRRRPKKHVFSFIVCNHVLQYYDTESQKLIIGNLKAVCRPEGFLYLEGLTSLTLAGTELCHVTGFANLYTFCKT